MSNEILHIIIPFFSFSDIDLRKNNLKQTLNYLKNFDNIHIIVAHGIYKKNNLDGEDFLNDKKISYLKYELPSILWVKENLINLAVKSLSKDWKYLCWIDSDIIFLNSNWVNEAINDLKKYDAVQLYQTVVYLDKNGNIDLNVHVSCHKPIMASFIFRTIKEKQYSYGATGFGFGINRDLYEKINGFFEFNIVGGGDFTFAVCAAQYFEDAKTSSLFSKMPSQDFFEKLMIYYSSFQGCKVNYLKGSICHLWHGNLDKRMYEPRLNIILKHEFSPSLHTAKNENGIIYLTNSELEKDILQYFKNRED